MDGAEAANGRVIAAYVAGARERALPAEVRDAARLCLADWLGVAIGAAGEEAGRIVREVALGWRSSGRSSLLMGGTAAAPVAALVNGTLAHCLDFDDTYVKGVTHTSAPVWAATLALGEEIGASEPDILAGFVTGFETTCRIGNGLGEPVTARGWHGTGVFGRLGAAAATAALLGLDATRALHALATAVTQTSGLTASFGTMAKPFHAGKAAMDGIVAGQLAAAGLIAATGILDTGGGLDNALVQDRSATIQPADFADWEILQNSFKPYAACHLTHPAIDAARGFQLKTAELARLREVEAEVGALAAQVTGGRTRDPATPLEGKFDLKYCVALGLHGHTVSAGDFREPWQPPPEVRATARKVRVSPSPDLGFASARLRAIFDDGRTMRAEVPVAKGHPGNPMTWSDMRDKFAALVEPRLGAAVAERLLGLVREFGSGGMLGEIRALLGRLHAGEAR
ncbi:MAG: MmgE/PrpD family protein [Alphaproteobacteria bacterium]|nr:MmgE/PrpD family protein [Alphaproteobacteria bacterium]